MLPFSIFTIIISQVSLCSAFFVSSEDTRKDPAFSKLKKWFGFFVLMAYQLVGYLIAKQSS